MICGCGCGCPFIVATTDVWLFEYERWIRYSVDTMIDSRPHPNPDTIIAAFAAAQLLGEVDD